MEDRALSQPTIRHGVLPCDHEKKSLLVVAVTGNAKDGGILVCPECGGWSTWSLEGYPKPSISGQEADDLAAFIFHGNKENMVSLESGEEWIRQTEAVEAAEEVPQGSALAFRTWNRREAFEWGWKAGEDAGKATTQAEYSVDEVMDFVITHPEMAHAENYRDGFREGFINGRRLMEKSSG